MSAQYGKWNFDGCATPRIFSIGSALCLLRTARRENPRHSTPRYRPNLALVRDRRRAPNQATTSARVGRSSCLGRPSRQSRRAGAGDGDPRATSCDVEIVAAAWSRWQENCLAKSLIGDWGADDMESEGMHAASLRRLHGDTACFLQIRSEFLRMVHGSRSAGSLLGTKSFARRPVSCRLAGFLPWSRPDSFSGIRRRVAPSSVITVRPGSCKSHRYWAFDGGKRIQYRRNKDYQDEFLELLSASVRRRLRTAFPVIAELSGGMDSSSIVCVADRLTTGGGSPSIDTLSYFNNQEPHWNELPWLTCVERKRGKAGLHIDLSSPPSADAQESFRFVARPGASSWSNQFLESMKGNGHRVLLFRESEATKFLGGVPTPLPELEDLLVQGRLVAMSKRLLAWALVQAKALDPPCAPSRSGLLILELFPGEERLSIQSLAPPCVCTPSAGSSPC